MKKFLIVLIIFIFIAIAGAFFWLRFIATLYKVAGHAMDPSFTNNDILLFKKINNLQRGDVILFNLSNSQNSRELMIRRVIGTPGDYIEIKNGKVFITPKDSEKTEELKEDYLAKDTKTCITISNSCASTLDFAGRKYQVPNDSYFVLGDNRSESQDSRFWRKEDGHEEPFIKSEDVVAKLNFKIWPL